MTLRSSSNKVIPDADPKTLPHLVKNSILDVLQGPEYISVFGTTQSLRYSFYKKETVWLLFTFAFANLHCHEYFYFQKIDISSLAS